MKLSRKEKFKTSKHYRFDRTFILGPLSSTNILRDPMHLAFVLSRYKFVARILTGKNNILEIGCGDALGTPIVAKVAENLTAVDIDPKLIESNQNRLADIKNIEFKELDIRCEVPPGKYQGIFSIDVIEHLESRYNDIFFRNIGSSLDKDGICITGTPNKTSEKYSSAVSRHYHINIFDFNSLRAITGKYFKNTLMFTMNDEVVQTGFGPMGHYLFAIGIGPKLTL